MHNTGFFPDCYPLSVTDGSIWIPYLARYSEILKKPNFQVVKWKSTFIWKMRSQAELQTEGSCFATIFGSPSTPRNDPAIFQKNVFLGVKRCRIQNKARTWKWWLECPIVKLGTPLDTSWTTSPTPRLFEQVLEAETCEPFPATSHVLNHLFPTVCWAVLSRSEWRRAVAKRQARSLRAPLAVSQSQIVQNTQYLYLSIVLHLSFWLSKIRSVVFWSNFPSDSFPIFVYNKKSNLKTSNPVFYVGVRWGDGSKTTSGTNSISTGTKIVPVGPLVPRKIFLSSKMMNSQPQHIQKREIVDMQIIKLKYKSKKKTLSYSI